jgi:hypothetical protein
VNDLVYINKVHLQVIFSDDGSVQQQPFKRKVYVSMVQ